MPAATIKTADTRSLWCCNICAVVCLVLVAVGLILTTFIRDAINDTLNSRLVAKFALDGPDASDFARWSNTTTATNAAVIYTDFYVYNYTNPEEIVRGGRPNVTEIGPLRYRFYNDKFDVTWDNEGDTINFRTWDLYVPDDATLLLQNMTITTLNVPLLGVLKSPLVVASAGGLAPLLPLIISGVPGCGFDGLFVQRTAGEVLFGWEDPLLQAMHGLDKYGLVPTRYPGIQSNDTSIEESRALHQPNQMYTGKSTIQAAREYLVWDGQSSMQCCPFGPCGDAGTTHPLQPAVSPWNSEEAEVIRGGFGDQFHQNVAMDETLYVSTHAFGIYRHWPLQASEQYDFKGVKLNRFQWAPGTLGNQSVSPIEAAAYNTFGPSGLLNQSACEWGAQIFLSKPRFLDASHGLAEAIDGMPRPNRQDDDLYVGVEQYTGTTMDFHWRVGVNVYVEPMSIQGTSQVWFNNTIPNYLPIAFADRYGNATDAEAQELQSQVYVARDLILAARWGGVALAIVGFFGAIGFFVLAWFRRKQIAQINALETERHYAQLYGGNGDLSKPMLLDEGIAAPNRGSFAPDDTSARLLDRHAGSGVAASALLPSDVENGVTQPFVGFGGSLNAAPSSGSGRR